jgi:hypothetical protein
MKGMTGMKDMKENTCLHLLILIMFFQCVAKLAVAWVTANGAVRGQDPRDC